MKKIIFFYSLAIVLMSGCKKVDIGYLMTENAQYANVFEIYKTPDVVIDAVRIQYKSPWVGKPIGGVRGTAPIMYEVVDVKSENGNAEIMKQELKMNGSGICNFPFESKTPVGIYKVSVRIYNEGHSAVKENILTIEVKDKRI